MIRSLSLLVFAILLLLAWKFGNADPRALAAFEAGNLMQEPLHELQGPGWQNHLGAGDVIRMDGDGPDSAEGTIESVADGRMMLTGGDPDGLPLQAADAFVSSSRSMYDVLLATRLVERTALDKFTGEEQHQSVRIHLGSIKFIDEEAEDLAAGETAILSRESRLSIVRTLRSGLGDSGVNELVDQDLSEPEIGSPAGILRKQGRRNLELQMALTPAGPRMSAQREAPLPGAVTLLPPLIAILLAILLRRPVLALLAGVVGGSWVYFGLQTESVVQGVSSGTAGVLTKFLPEVVRDNFYLQIVGFVIAMLAMVGIMTRAGGVQGLMDRISRLASNAKRTQIATWFMGLAVFFDDYANTILVGSTMRPLTDRFKVAREKLAYIVDSTAAPVAGLSLLSTWIAFEVSTFSNALPDAGLAQGDGYGVFLQTLPYRFYCILTLAFVGMVVLSGRDFGPMLHAERRARKGQVLRPGATPMVGKAATEMLADPTVTPRARVAVVPLLTFVLVTILSILWRGGITETLSLSSPGGWFDLQAWAQILYGGSGSEPLLYGSLAGLGMSLVLAWSQGAKSGLFHAAFSSVRSMGVALAILYLAWMLGAVCGALGTSTYLTVQLGDTIPPMMLPVILFLLAGLVAFSTGSSWSTMTILLPLVVGLSFRLGETSDLGGLLLMIMSIGAVLEGAIFGDHCSPISDTTVMSSIACASDHIDHVRTQMPYAILTMGVAIVFGYLPCTFLGAETGTWLPFACLGAGILALALVLRIFGQRADEVAV